MPDIGFTLELASAMALGGGAGFAVGALIDAALVHIRLRKIGGIYWLRVARLRFAFCVAKQRREAR